MRVTPLVLLALFAGVVAVLLLVGSPVASSAVKRPLPELKATPLHQRPSARTFASRNAVHHEPLLGFRVRHVDNAHLHTPANLDPQSIHPMKRANKANSIGAHSMRMRYRNGHRQPFPDSITVVFHAFDREFRFEDMQLDTRVLAPDAKLEVHSPDQEPTFEPHTLSTYFAYVDVPGVSDPADATTRGWAIVSLSEDGLMTATLNMGDEVYQVHPLYVHRGEFENAETFEALSAEATHNMVVTRHSDMKHLQDSQESCGEPLVPPDEDEEPNFGSPVATSAAEAAPTTREEVVRAAQRRLLAAALPPGQGVTRWTNCYAGDTTAHKLSVGIVVDFGFFQIYGSVGSAQIAVANMYAAVNAVYVAQFNVFLELQSVTIKTGLDSDVFNRAPTTYGGRCDIDINTDLTDFTSWRTKAPQAGKYALWHLLTACYPAPGTVGLAYIGVLCRPTYGTGVSSWNYATWLTLAHETGHNFGAQHAFDLGQGTTGGIMDYGDGQYPIGSGIIQFHPTYAQTDVCSNITKILTSSAVTPYCFAAYSPTCGNGILETGEQCDDGGDTACCKSCRLVGQCTPGASNQNTCCTASCTYMPSTTTCMSSSYHSSNPLGYCSNGKCQESICPYYASMVFCGMTTNGCKFQCGGGPNSYACTSGWSTPNTNVPSGTYCAPNSACDGQGVCVTTQPAVTYTWSTGTPGTCSCAGTATRTVTCMSSQGGSVDNSYCSSAGQMPSTTVSCAAPSTCYVWQQVQWSQCSVDCGGGRQTCTVQCVQGSSNVSPGAVASSSLCNSATQPAASQSCNNQACPTAWVQGGWSACTKSCDGGTQTQSVTCMQTQNGVKSTVSSSLCAGQQPASQQACNTQTCTDGAYAYTQWSQCSATCGGGTQTRTQSCVNAQNVPYPDNTACVGATPQPTQQACNTSPCPVYQWGPGSYGECSATCGGGIQTRTVNCYDDANDPQHRDPVSSGYCPTVTKPTSVQSCNAQSCPVPPNYQWSTADWAVCSATCGGGTQTRLVTCINTVDGKRAASDTLCVNPKPDSQQTCAVQGCPTYSWVQSGFAACTKSCGGGVQTQTVTCLQDGTSTIVPDDYCSRSSSKPATQQSCNIDACPDPTPGTPPHTWSQGAPSPCSAACGGGIQTFTPVCLRTDVTPNTVVDASTCADLVKPPTQQACALQACPTYWYASQWSICSATCGGKGTQTRQVSCFSALDDPLTATSLADTKCTASKPATVRPCNTFDCPKWRDSSPWSACSAECGAGTQTRDVTCVNYDGSEVSAAECAALPTPPVSQPCTALPCPHWHRFDWSECSKPCGDANGPGTQTRVVTCLMPHDDPRYNGVDASTVAGAAQCSLTTGDPGDGIGSAGVVQGKPVTTQSCNIDACPTYYWSQSQPSACSASCGGGTRTVQVKCIDASKGEEASSASLCIGTAPASIIPCNTQACPKYEWQTTEWSACSSFCATGIQTRTVTCINTKPDASVQYSSIAVDASLCVAAIGAAPAAKQVCTQPESTCWGTAYASGGHKNGRCAADGNSCVCRSGYAGARCTDYAKITKVATNGGVYGTPGIPLNAPLVITWNSSTTDLPTVSILLQRTGWPTGQYLATSIPNTNSWTWEVGSILKSSGLDGGDGYSIRVWYSANSYDSDSAAFTIADPCAYMSCGAHGTCSDGECICSTGYQGATCAIGPCERASCAPTTSSCTNEDAITSGAWLTSNVCGPCLNGYTGAQCRTPATCSQITCANGADLTNVVLAPNGRCSGSCSCIGNFVGSNCSTCAWPCQNGGVPSADCTTCTNCNAGFFGNHCHCQYYTLDFRFLADVTAWYGTDTTIQSRWSRTLEQDIMSAAATVATDAVSAKVLSITPNGASSVDVAVRFSLDCSEQSHSQAPLAQPIASRRLLAATQSNSSLVTVYNLFLPLLSDTDSPLWHGQVTSRMDTTYKVRTSDPSGQQSLASPQAATDCYDNACGGTAESTENAGILGSSGISVGLIAGVIIGVLVLLTIIIAVYLFLRSRASRGDTKLRTHHARETHEMASAYPPPASAVPSPYAHQYAPSSQARDSVVAVANLPTMGHAAAMPPPLPMSPSVASPSEAYPPLTPSPLVGMRMPPPPRPPMASRPPPRPMPVGQQFHQI